MKLSRCDYASNAWKLAAVIRGFEKALPRPRRLLMLTPGLLAPTTHETATATGKLLPCRIVSMSKMLSWSAPQNLQRAAEGRCSLQFLPL